MEKGSASSLTEASSQSKTRQNSAPRWIGESREGQAEMIRHVLYLMAN